MKEFEIKVISSDFKEQFILSPFIGKRFITLCYRVKGNTL